MNNGRPARELIAEELPDFVHQSDQIVGLFRAFMARKREQGLLDFDDLLLCWAQLLDDPVIGAKLRRRWDWVLVDEYQDVNRAQVDIVARLRPDGSGLTVVGDDAQAIYGFRGACGAHLGDVLHRLPDATLVRLQRNFRSLQPVLDLANVIRPGEGDTRLHLSADRDAERAPRPVLVHCEDADTEARMIADAVLDAQQDGRPLKEQAVLMRAGSHSKALEVELAVRNIPYVKYGGIRFLNTAHVRDLVAALRVTTNPRDELSWYRLLCLHRNVGRAIGPHAHRAVAHRRLGTRWPGHQRRRGRRTGQGAHRVGRDPDPARGRPQHERRHRPGRRVPGRGAPADPGPLRRLAGPGRGRRPHRRRRRHPSRPRRVRRRTHPRPCVVQRRLRQGPAQGRGLPDPVDRALGERSGMGSVHLLHAVDGAFPSDMALSDDDGLNEEQRLSTSRSPAPATAWRSTRRPVCRSTGTVTVPARSTPRPAAS